MTIGKKIAFLKFVLVGHWCLKVFLLVTAHIPSGVYPMQRLVIPASVEHRHQLTG
jgi:hypothetical protein